MTAVLTAGLPTIGALIGALAVGYGWGRITRPMSPQRALRWLLVPIAFVVLVFCFGALAVALVGGEVVKTYVFDGSRGPVVWQVNEVVIFDDDGDTVQRTRLDIRNVDTGKRIVRRDDYVHWWVVPIEVEVLGEGHDVVWLYSETQRLHTRDIYDGHFVKAYPGIGRKAVKYDASSRSVVVANRPLEPAGPNRFDARFDHDLQQGGRYELQNGSLVRVDDRRMMIEKIGSAHFADPWFASSTQVSAEVPDAFFVVDKGNLSRVDKRDGRVRWTQQGVLDSKRTAADAAYVRNGKLCVLQDDRLACFELETGRVEWVIR